MSTQPSSTSAPRPNGLSRAPPAQASAELAGRGKAFVDANTPRPPKTKALADMVGGDPSRKTNGNESSRRTRSRAREDGEKVVIRRLPPSMTEAEFVAALGPEWALSKGKVDWLSYCLGKLSTDPAKPSRPSRAYLHITRKDDIMSLSQVIRGTAWEDSKGSFANFSSVGPPTLEISIYRKVPGTKRRVDSRQGTIDQDQEFMAFLESLANPPPPKEMIDGEDADDSLKDEAKVNTTPLVEYLKEKRANKSKDSGSGKVGAKLSSAKLKPAPKEEEAVKHKGKERKIIDKSDKPPKDTVRILTKKATPEQTPEAIDRTPGQTSATNAATGAANDAPKNRRAGIAAAARILQRELGLSSSNAHRRARHDATKADADAKGLSGNESTPSTSKVPASSANCSGTCSTSKPLKSRPQSPVAPKLTQPTPPPPPSPSSNIPGRRVRGGRTSEKGKAAEVPATPPTGANPLMILKKRNETGDASVRAAEPQPSEHRAPNGKLAASSPLSNAKGSASKQSTPTQRRPVAVSAGATRAFVRLASPSQRVTEADLRQTLEAFGTVSLVDMDRRKGFAYVDFDEHRSLVRAVNASPVQVAQTTVQVLERKDKRPATFAGTGSSGPLPADKGTNRGRRGRGRGNGAGSASGKISGSRASQMAAPAAHADGSG